MMRRLLMSLAVAVLMAPAGAQDPLEPTPGSEPFADSLVTRADALVMVIQGLRLDKDAPMPVRTGDPAARLEENQVITQAAEQMNMLPPGFGSLDEPANRSDMAALLVRGLEASGKGAEGATGPALTDVTQSTPYRDEISRAVSLDLMPVFPDKTFRPYQPVQRADVVQMVTRLKEEAGMADTAAPGDPAVPPQTSPAVPATESPDPGRVIPEPWVLPAVVAGVVLIGLLIWLAVRPRGRVVASRHDGRKG